ncbi:MAG: class I tRNA ligase family protein, partial [Pseudomonadota bacterium]
FVWSVFCDWYLELSKPILQGADGEDKAEVRHVLSWTLERIFEVLHPFMPFITETLWEQTAARESFLMQQSWPGLSDGFADRDATAEMDWVLSVISQIRSVRSDVNVPAGAKVPVRFIGANEITTQRIETHRDVIMRLARLETLAHADSAPAGGVKAIVGEATLVLEIADLIDAGEEVARLDKQLGKIGGEITGLEKRLGNEAFVAKAPADIVTEQRQRLADLKGTHDKLSLARDQLAAL